MSRNPDEFSYMPYVIFFAIIFSFICLFFSFAFFYSNSEKKSPSLHPLDYIYLFIFAPMFFLIYYFFEPSSYLPHIILLWVFLTITLNSFFKGYIEKVKFLKSAFGETEKSLLFKELIYFFPLLLIFLLPFKKIRKVLKSNYVLLFFCLFIPFYDLLTNYYKHFSGMGSSHFFHLSITFFIAEPIFVMLLIFPIFRLISVSPLQNYRNFLKFYSGYFALFVFVPFFYVFFTEREDVSSFVVEYAMNAKREQYRKEYEKFLKIGFINLINEIKKDGKVLEDEENFKRYKKIFIESFKYPFLKDEVNLFNLKIINKKDGGFLVLSYDYQSNYYKNPDAFVDLYWIDERGIFFKNNWESLPEEAFH